MLACRCVRPWEEQPDRRVHAHGDADHDRRAEHLEDAVAEQTAQQHFDSAPAWHDAGAGAHVL